MPTFGADFSPLMIMVLIVNFFMVFSFCSFLKGVFVIFVAETYGIEPVIYTR